MVLLRGGGAVPGAFRGGAGAAVGGAPAVRGRGPGRSGTVRDGARTHADRGGRSRPGEARSGACGTVRGGAGQSGTVRDSPGRRAEARNLRPARAAAREAVSPGLEVSPGWWFDRAGGSTRLAVPPGWRFHRAGGLTGLVVPPGWRFRPAGSISRGVSAGAFQSRGLFHTRGPLHPGRCTWTGCFNQGAAAPKCTTGGERMFLVRLGTIECTYRTTKVGARNDGAIGVH